MATVGKILKAKREEKHLTIEEISAKTKVNQKFLQAIENEEFDLLPPYSFAVGLVKLFAGAVGLDEGAIAAQFKRETGHTPESQRANPEASISGSGLNKKVIPAWAYLAIIAIIVIILMGSYGWFRGTPRAAQSTVTKSTEAK
jgi:cytoskeleton protein RodZ